jgi:hypothetical protein
LGAAGEADPPAGFIVDVHILKTVRRRYDLVTAPSLRRSRGNAEAYASLRVEPNTCGSDCLSRADGVRRIWVDGRISIHA